MNAEEMKMRTRQFSIDVGHFILSLYSNDYKILIIQIN